MYHIRIFRQSPELIYSCVLNECISNYDYFRFVYETIFNFPCKFIIYDHLYDLRATLIEIDDLILIEHDNNFNN